MKRSIHDSLGMELNQDCLKIICLRNTQIHYQVLAKYHIQPLSHELKLELDRLFSGLQQQAPQLKLSKMPLYMTLSGDFVGQHIFEIEADLLRLNTKAIKHYISVELTEHLTCPLPELFWDYVLPKPAAFTQSKNKIFVAWIEKSFLKPYLKIIKAMGIKVKAVELADISVSRYENQILPIQDLEGIAKFFPCCGAAMRAWCEHGA